MSWFVGSMWALWVGTLLALTLHAGFWWLAAAGAAGVVLAFVVWLALVASRRIGPF
jgi:hypothetical protein